jgi:hypothetical protein
MAMVGVVGLAGLHPLHLLEVRGLVFQARVGMPLAQQMVLLEQMEELTGRLAGPRPLPKPILEAAAVLVAVVQAQPGRQGAHLFLAGAAAEVAVAKQPSPRI